jgi:hypothetical protein
MDCHGIIDHVLANLSDLGLVLILLLGIGSVVMAFYNDFKLDNPIVTLFALIVSIPVFLLFVGSLQQAICEGAVSWELVVMSSLTLLTYLWAITHLLKAL